MAYTLGTTVTKVQQRIADTGYSSTEIKGYINDTQNDIFNEYRLPFMEDTQDYTLTVGVSDITNGSGLPDNYVQALDILMTTAGTESILTYVDIRSIDDMSDTSTGIPTKWYNYEDTIRVNPAPSSAYTIKLRYYKKPTEITSDASVPEVPSEFQEILTVGAAYRVMQAKDNYDQAAILQNKYDELLQKLVMKYTFKQVGQPTIMRINRNGLGKAHF